MVYTIRHKNRTTEKKLSYKLSTFLKINNRKPTKKTRFCKISNNIIATCNLAKYHREMVEYFSVSEIDPKR